MLLILCLKPSSRISYICKHVCKTWGLDYKLTQDKLEFSQWENEKISYHPEVTSSKISILPAGLLENNAVENLVPPGGQVADMPVIFKDESDFGFDILSAIFYMLSRYEEYLAFDADEHGRFPARSSLAFKNNFLHLPVIEIWMFYLKRKLKENFPWIKFAEERFDSILTYDIDVAFKFRKRNFFQMAGGYMKDLIQLNFRNISDRTRVLTGREKDPWDVYDFVAGEIAGKDLKGICFFLSGRRSKYDRNVQTRRMKDLFNRLKTVMAIGLHPSYLTLEYPERIREEKRILEKNALTKVTSSRQHFLKFKLPSTYRALLEAGITEDYSMAFPDMPGFRAGTSRPFLFYDLEAERETTLRIFPACWMDFTCTHYLKFSTAQIRESVSGFLKIVKQWNGVFIPIFHNNLLGSKEAKSVHARLIKEMLIAKNEST